MSILGKLKNLAGQVGDAIVPGDQSYLHQQAPRQQANPNQQAFTVQNINSAIGGMPTPATRPGSVGGRDMGWAVPYAPIQSVWGAGQDPNQPGLIHFEDGSYGTPSPQDLPLYLRRK